ncbi:MAG: 16S rRNA (guanine(527)-N(7))-methyltransferase RsmG [Bacilli bacterium]|nr:16S rRNA (guanine(527)-N(7))-methyltransferase RsmG [Bacilli bacterium]
MNYLQLQEYLKNEGIKISDEQLTMFSTYSKMLKEWNEKFNLTAITDEEEIIEKHFLDSLILGKYVNLSNKKVLDIGTGAGFPGIPLAILFPNANISLSDSNGKKITFLNEVVKELNLKNVTVIQSRIEDMAKFKDQFDYVTARALKALNILIELAIPLCKVHGSLIAYKGPNYVEEIHEAKNALKCLDAHVGDCHQYTLGESKDSRAIVLVWKAKPTKHRYPRNYSLIASKPL